MIRSSAVLILQLQLLIARAAQKDSLGWWDDESLTAAGAFILERLFPSAPEEIARKLGLATAAARHQAAFADHPEALHLFRLDTDGETNLELSRLPLMDCPIPTQPIESMAVLQLHLSSLLGDRPARRPSIEQLSNRRVAIRWPSQGLPVSAVDIAKALAWAYLSGKPVEPVFPFIRS
ncbi:MAG: BrxE family protein [Chloroflexi bacterium]|nr:BrxE family protein [Chloroflexota bacterium]MBI3732791.1 BrxE family protein [Chloroflexota bacterium]